MTTWLTVKEAMEKFKVGRHTLMIDSQLAGARHTVGNGKKYVIDAEALDYYRKTKQRA